jgi:DNA-binding CsgD family transcriptional regulator/tetratricopeptide (TPR) repeat protein
MGAWVSRTDGFVGRRVERELLRGTLVAARENGPVAVVVHGEAGVGKTRLVAGALTEAADDRTVLWASCLRLGAVSMPALPLTTTLEAWSTTATDDERDAVHAAAPALAELLDAAASGRPVSPQMAFGTVQHAVQALAAHRPTVLVVDDVQWADPTTRDVIGYLLADPRPVPLCVWLTWRDDAANGDAATAWLGDVRRLPAVCSVRVDRFDEDDTREQLRARLGAEPDPELVRQLFARTDGNAYFNELLADEIDTATGRLPAVLPDALRTALLSGWQRLSEPARQVLLLLAVAGHPTTTGVLGRVARELGVPGSVGDAVRESVAAGAVRPRGDSVWFRHPLIAEVLVEELLPDEAAARHRAFALGVGDDLPRTDLARHQALGGLVDEAFASCLAGAAEADAAGAFTLQTDLLVRAAGLHPRLSEEARRAQPSEASVCADAAYAARRVGETELAVRLAGHGRTVIETEPDPARRARLLSVWAELASVESGTDARAALEQAAALAGPDSVERARALAWLGDDERRNGEVAAAREHLDEAVATARRSRDPGALSFAIGLRVDVGADPEADAEECWQTALASGIPEAIGLAAIPRVNYFNSRGMPAEAADLLLEAWQRADDAGIGGISMLLGAYAGTFLLEVGRTTEAQDVLRRVLASAPRGLAGNQARQAAAVLAVRQGRMAEADRHVAWLHEVTGTLMDVPGMYGPATLVEHHLAHDRPQDALALLGRSMRAHTTTEPRFGDRLLAWSARAAAELADRGRRSGDQALVTQAVDALHRLEAERATVGPAFEEENPVVAAWQAVFVAESARCAGTASAEDWQRAADRCAEAAMPHEQAAALLHLAACSDNRTAAAAALRRAHAVASAMGAAPLVAEAEALAATARIPLAEPVTPTAPPGSAADRLTAREREVLGHLVAGRTYAEIAAALFISEKTVSVHVSNLLRKTGTSSRVEAAAWARREGVTGDAQPHPHG